MRHGALGVRVLIVGAGFAGRLHAEAWRRLGHDTVFYDPRLGLDALEDKIRVVDVVDFCDAPISRVYYTLKYADLLREKRLVVYEKPPVPPELHELWRAIEEYLGNVLPVHNYLYMPHITSVIARDGYIDVRVLREGPHKAWYPSRLTGGGILVDHGYHWMYVAREILHVPLWEVECTLLPPRPPDYHAACRGDRLRMLLTWSSPVTETWLNGRRLESQPFTRENQVNSLVELFRDEESWGLHVDVAGEVLDAINRIYSAPRPPEPREGPTYFEVAQLLPVDPNAVYAAAIDSLLVYRSTGRLTLTKFLDRVAPLRWQHGGD